MSALHSAHPAAVQPIPSGLYHAVPHAMHWTRAQAIIRQRGHFANITLDGLLATSWEAYTGNPTARADDDEWHEAPTVFAIDDSGRVATKPIREWLGLSQAGVLIEGAAATA